jgi:hypothetical protein
MLGACHYSCLTLSTEGEEKEKYNLGKPAHQKLTPVQVSKRLEKRLMERMEAPQRVKLEGFSMVLAELDPANPTAAMIEAAITIASHLTHGQNYSRRGE